MSLNVKESLKLEVFCGAKVLAGKSGLHNQVRWVNVLEVLDETKLLQQGELLLTTAYGLESDARLQEQLIPELAARGLAGLIVQVGHYLQSIPGLMCRQAEEHHFPLIQLPKNISFASVTQAVNRQITNRQIEILEYAGRIHSRLTSLVLEGRGLPALAQTLADLTGKSVRIVGPFFQLLAAAGTENAGEEKVGREFLALARRGLLDTVSKERKPLQVKEMINSGLSDQYIFPVSAGSSLLAYISVLGTGSPLDELAGITVSQTATLCALEMLKAQAVRETENRLRGDFLEDLLLESPASTQDLIRRAQYFGYDDNKKQIILLLDLDDFQNLAVSRTEAEILEIKRKLTQLVDMVLTRTPYQAIYKYRRESLVLLLQVPPDTGREQITGWTEKLKAQAVDFIHPLTFSAGIGQPCTGLKELPRSYQEAAMTLEVIRATGRQNTVLYFKDLGIYRLLTRLRDDPELFSFYRSCIGPLVDYDRRRGTQLVDTLRTYYRHNGNLKEIAASMFIHRHTLRYRLSRIQEICQMKLQDPDDRLALEVGIKLLPLLEHAGNGRK